MKFGVITFPGSNCDLDMIRTLERITGEEVVRLWHKNNDLQGAEFIVLPGGFSYGDYLRSGAIARFSPIMQSVIAHANKGGYVLGICNGFQVLCECDLLAGTLIHNEQQKFICKNVHIRPASKKGSITKNLEQKAYKIPIAHGEGNYYAKQESIEEMQKNDQILFQYSRADGFINEEANPNGSANNIAGIMNKKGNVMGMMPHPERAADPVLGNEDGAALFKSILSST